MAVGAVVASIVSQYTDKGSKAARKDIAKLGKDFDAAAKKITKSFLVAAAASAAFAIKLGKDSVQAAAADEKQQAALATALRNTTNATEEAIAANIKYLDALELQVAIDNEKLIPALQQLAQATGDLSQAQLLLRLSTDVSVASGKDLGTVSAAITKAINGQFGALTKLGLPLDQNAIKSKDLGKILVQLSQISRGQAAAAADTFAGKLESLRLKFNQISDTLGYALMPSILLFAEYLETKIAPALEYFLYLNEGRLTAALESGVKNIKDIANAFGNIYNVISGINDLLPIGIGGWIQLAVGIKAVTVAGGVLATVLSILTIRSKMNKDIVEKATLSNKKFRDILLSDASSGEKLLRVYYRMKGALLNSTPSVFIISQFHKMKTAMLASAAAGNKLSAALVLIGTRLKQLAALLLKTPWGRIALAAMAVVGVIAKLTGDKKITISDQMRAAEYSMWKAAKATESMDDALNKYRETQSKVVKKTKEQIADEKRLAAIKAKQLAEDKKRAKFEADYAKLNETLAKRAGVKLLSSEDEKMVQINAAIALADRQKEINKLDKERLERMKDEILSLKVRNDLAKRYQDILQALADQKIDTKEIAILAKLWEVPIEAVEAYLATLFAVEDATITDDEIVNLAMKWGSTQEQAARYLDFFTYLNDGFLSDAEIEKLKTKWKMTEEQVRMYADFVGIVNDGKLTDAEIVKIQNKWKLTTDQVVDYIKYIGSPVSYSGTLIDPARAAEIGWLNAIAALERYLALLKAGTGVIVPKNVPGGFVSGSGEDPAVIAAANAAAAAAAKAAADAAAALAESEEALNNIKEASSAASARDYAIAKVLGDQEGMMLAAAGVNPSTLAAAEGGALGAASITAQLRAAEQALQNERIMATYASFKAKENAENAAAAANAGVLGGSMSDAAADAAERARFRGLQSGLASGTVATGAGISGGNLMAAPIINVTVQGSVTSEQDLVTTIRNGLLSQQYNGDSITLQAV